MKQILSSTTLARAKAQRLKRVVRRALFVALAGGLSLSLIGNPAVAIDTPATYATSVAGTWANLASATGVDDSACSTTTTAFNPIDLTGLGFALTQGASVTGIGVEVKYGRSAGTGGGAVTLLKDGTPIATSRSTGTAIVGSCAATTYITMGAADLWGETWTPDEINSSAFGLRVISNAGSAATRWLDAARVVIGYVPDTTAPALSITSPVDDAFTNVAAPTLSGVAGTLAGDSSSVTVNIYAGSEASGTPVQTLPATADENGLFEVTVDPALTDGVYTAQAEQSDDAGNTGSSLAINFTVDTIGEPPAITSPVDASFTNGTPTISGTAEVDANVEILIDGGSVATVGAPGGSWSYTLSTGQALEEGSHSVAAQATDLAGNESSLSPETGFTADTTAPDLTSSVSPESNANGWNNADVTVTFLCTDDLSGVDLISDPITLTDDGENQSASGTCTDLVGNEGNLLVVGINIDMTLPAIDSTFFPDRNANGWNNTGVEVTLSCSDALSGVFLGGDPTVQVIEVETEGTDVSHSCTDEAGNVASLTESAMVDLTSPVIELERSVAANANGWNNTLVDVTLSCSDVLSGLETGDTPTAQSITAETAGTDVSHSCTDFAGNDANRTETVKLDVTVPGIGASTVTPDANAAGWHNTDVTVSFECTDELSGVDSEYGSTTLVTEGADQTASANCQDLAGNPSDLATVEGIDIDKTAPAISALRIPPANQYGWNNTNVSVTLSCADPLSGVEIGVTPTVQSFTVDAVGSNATKSCTDVAGNTGSRTEVVRIDRVAPSAAVTFGQVVIRNAGGRVRGTVYEASPFTANSGVKEAVVTFTDVMGMQTSFTTSAISFGSDSSEWELNPTGLAAGTYSVSVRGRDLAGNTGGNSGGQRLFLI